MFDLFLDTMSALTRDLGFENLDSIIVVSQGSSQKSVGDVSATLTVSAFEQKKIVKSSPWVRSPQVSLKSNIDRTVYQMEM